MKVGKHLDVGVQPQGGRGGGREVEEEEEETNIKEWKFGNTCRR